MQKIIRNRSYVTIMVLMLALLGLVSRLTQLLILQILAFCLTIAAAVVVVYRQKPRPAYLPNHRPSLFLLFPMPAALFLVIGAVLQLLQKNWTGGISGLAGAVCMALICVCTVSRKAPSLMLYLILTASLILRLIPDFRRWSVDPVLTDYCFRLFAQICVMAATLHVGSFVLKEGKRRLTAGLCICGVVFCVMAAADGGLAEALVYLGYAVFLFGELWGLLRPGRKKRTKTPDPNPEEGIASDETADWNHL